MSNSRKSSESHENEESHEENSYERYLKEDAEKLQKRLLYEQGIMKKAYEVIEFCDEYYMKKYSVPESKRPEKLDSKDVETVVYTAFEKSEQLVNVELANGRLDEKFKKLATSATKAAHEGYLKAKGDPMLKKKADYERINLLSEVNVCTLKLMVENQKPEDLAKYKALQQQVAKDPNLTMAAGAMLLFVGGIGEVITFIPKAIMATVFGFVPENNAAIRHGLTLFSRGTLGKEMNKHAENIEKEIENRVKPK